MRLKSVFVSEYKNLKNFTLGFDGASFIDVFVGKNGSGKSNLFEALIEIFRHLYEYDKEKGDAGFEYAIKYEIDGKETEVTWKAGKFSIDGKARATIGKTPLPDNVLIYYSGHNDTVAGLVDKYEANFGKRIKKADFDESRRFIGIGPEYKALLLAVLLMQKSDSMARLFIREKLGIRTVSPEVRLELQRPGYASDTRYAIEDLEADRYWKPEGITKAFLDRLSKCISPAIGSPVRSEGYFAADGRYILYFDITKVQQQFADLSAQELFRQFDNLKTLGMLAEISIQLTLASGLDATIGHFSDGQFQSVYIYSITELFKDRNCLTLLDEPDSFLHPEWQFDFLRQVFEITGAGAQNIHVLMSSHSAVTLIPHDRRKVKFFDIKDDCVNCFDLPKSVAIKKLSADLIRYSEQEQLLSIINAIQIENKPVLFTEGSTDPIILKAAWYKLYDEEMPFIPFYAFSCTYIHQLLTDNRIHKEMGGLPVFALCDFDKAYDQWNGLNGTVIESDPFRGMIKQWASGESYAIMLPVSAHADIQKQVIKDAATNETFGGDSFCEIEHLFYGQAATTNYYQQEPCVGGTKIIFKSDGEKTAFAREIVPTLEATCFKVFRPMFDFIISKCPAKP
jgi:predicted ATPase